MDLTYQECEHIKSILQAQGKGVEIVLSQYDAVGSVAAIMGFLGMDMTEEQAKDAIRDIREQFELSKKIIDKINNEFGLNNWYSISE